MTAPISLADYRSDRRAVDVALVRSERCRHPSRRGSTGRGCCEMDGDEKERIQAVATALIKAIPYGVKKTDVINALGIVMSGVISTLLIKEGRKLTNSESKECLDIVDRTSRHLRTMIDEDST